MTNARYMESCKAKEYRETEKLAFYLISLFYKTNCKYFCSRPKINRLLTIYKLCSVSFDPDCFHYYFHIDEPYMIIGGPINLIERDVYCNQKVIDGKLEFVSKDNREFFDGVFTDNLDMPYIYHINEDEISRTKIHLLEIIFRKFASYPISDLAKMINELHHDIPFEQRIDSTSYTYNYLDPNKFIGFLNSDVNKVIYKNNEVFKFIKIIVNEFKDANILYENAHKNHVLKIVKKQI